MSTLAGAARDGLLEALRDGADFLVESMDSNMPVGDPAEDPNPAVALADSIEIVEEPEHGTIEVQVRTPYAAKQELDQRLNHPRGGGHGYTEDAKAVLESRFRGIVASRVRAHMGAQARRLKKDRR